MPDSAPCTKSKIVFLNLKKLKLTKQRFANSEFLCEVIRISFPNLEIFHFERIRNCFESKLCFKDLPKNCETVWTNCCLLDYFAKCVSIRNLHVLSVGQDQEVLPMEFLDSAQFSLEMLSVNFHEMNYTCNPDGPVVGSVEQILVMHPDLKVLSVSSPHYEIYVESELVEIWLDKMKDFLRRHSIELMIFSDEIVVLKKSLDQRTAKLVSYLDDQCNFSICYRYKENRKYGPELVIKEEYKLPLEPSFFTFQW